MPTDSAIVEAVRIATLGLITMFAGYRLLGFVAPKLAKLRVGVDVARNQDRLLAAAAVGVVIGAYRSAVILPASMVQIINDLHVVSKAALGGVMICWLRGTIKPRNRIIFVVLFIVMNLAELGGGGVGGTFLNLFLFATIYLQARGRVPWVPLFIALAMLFPFMTTKHKFRQIAWGNKNFDLGPVERGVYFIQLTAEMVSSGEADFETLQDTASDRANHLATLTYVMVSTPSLVPYWEGESYASLVWSFVPRIIYPDKPTKTLGNEFGHRYQLLDPADFGTSYNFEQLVEAYANFGGIGVLVMQFIFGAIYRMTEELGGTGKDDGATLLSASAAALVFSIESDASLVFGSLIFYIPIGLIGLRWLLKPPKGAQQA
ncbi:MAG: hypothetical protein ACHREM_02830 [Polyangiales bacterium]